MIRWFFVSILILLCDLVHCQCSMLEDRPYSTRIANHKIDLTLDHEKKRIEATQVLTWTNLSDVTVTKIPFYTYLNAFKNSNSTFIKTSNGNPFGQNLVNRTEDTWGWIEISYIGISQGMDLTDRIQYVHADGNTDDQTVMELTLTKPLLPGEEIILDIQFTCKVPKTIARVGYSKNFFLLVHWFPQPGVLEKNATGSWQWNCRQGHRRTEFFNEFGNYEVSITCDQNMVVGATGCEVGQVKNDDGTQTVSYYAEDVHSFAWTAYFDFVKYKDEWKHVEITLLSPPEHSGHALRFITAVKNALEYFEEHVAIYPYPTLTIMNPPFHGLRSGFMEYPTFITTGSIAGFPTGVKTIESLAVHEFAHQYFMGMVASNEKEEPWLDEGFVTYFEDEIMKTYYGEKTSLFDILGYRVGNTELSRNEYVSLPNPSVGIINRPAWEFTEARKGLIYSKTACILNTLKNYLGQEKMDFVIKSYFDKWSFKHPQSQDCFESIEQSLYQVVDSLEANYLFHFFEAGINTTQIIDYSISQVTNLRKTNSFGIFGSSDNYEYKKGETVDSFTNIITVHKYGSLQIPTQILMEYEDGSTITEEWAGDTNSITYKYASSQKIISAHVDPNQRITLDLDFNNNSITIQKPESVFYKYGLKALHWVQNSLQTITFLM